MSDQREGARDRWVRPVWMFVEPRYSKPDPDGGRQNVAQRRSQGKTPSRQTKRDRLVGSIQTDGRLKWQASTGYGKRVLIETAMGRYKGIIGRGLRAGPVILRSTDGGCHRRRHP
ncbi:IS5 family insertion sequence transposase domain-containing protein (plasmid) [Rhizobium etli 8C-3]|uniref:IS5 family insertion sequence transposase domain-containing protein n=1 Tax=Rhizobium etli 8C-3 TaxID=538025 RepID=A0A1L5PA16_RHIET|nr:IS5 family insertion sequence transposase domain-containing protein [Rhizobium etli 8C-3]